MSKLVIHQGHPKETMISLPVQRMHHQQLCQLEEERPRPLEMVPDFNIAEHGTIGSLCKCIATILSLATYRISYYCDRIIDIASDNNFMYSYNYHVVVWCLH